MGKGASGYKDSSLSILQQAIETGHKDGSIAKDMDSWLYSILLWSTSNGVIQMLKNRGEFLQAMGIPIDKLYPAKELLINRGMAPVADETEKKAE